MADELFDTGPMSSFSISEEIDSICDQFESQWKAGAAPDISLFLDRIAPQFRGPLLVELIRSDVEHRIKRGDQPSISDYIDRFNAYRAEIKSIDIEPNLTESAHLAWAASLSAPGTPALSPNYVPGGDMRLGHYLLLERVGGGAFGNVWKAQDGRLNRIVAVKIPKPQYATQQGMGSILREGQAAARLKHPNIVAVHAVEENDDTIWIVSDFVEGGSLKALMSEDLSFSVSASLCAKLAEALHHAHEHGVVHRDLKPANVLVDAAGEPQITDFGLAKNLSAHESIATDGRVLGTPAYMSPEQARGESMHVDGRADAFSLGVILYQMLTGELPFSGDQSTVLRKILHTEPAPPRKVRRTVPRDLETICLKAMEKDVERRYKTAQEMAVDLHRYLRGDNILARRPNWAERTWRWMRKHPGWTAAGVLAGSVLIALGFVMYLLVALDNAHGYRDVTITTEPIGAQVAFAPLDPATGEPRDKEVIYAPGVTPVQLRLKPGDYFVVAVLGDPNEDDVRFHEVYRHVPEKGEVGRQSSMPHQAWAERDNASIELPSITIPKSNIDNEMVLFFDGEDDATGFLLAPYEFTLDDHRRLNIGDVPNYATHFGLSGNDALPVPFDKAMRFAELAGARLPTDREFIAVASEQADSASQVPPKHTTKEFGDVSPVDDRFDLIETKRGSVWGLRSNVAEWTTSRMQINGSRMQIVRGGDGTVVDGTNALGRSPTAMSYAYPGDTKRGLGFRLFRSAKPRYLQSQERD